MKLRDLLESGLVKDTDKISMTVCTRHHLTLPKLVSGHWYEDRILDCTEMEITELEYGPGNNEVGIWLFTLEEAEEDK